MRFVIYLTTLLLLMEGDLEKKEEDGVKFFVCSYEGCGRRFRAQFSLNRHLIIHSGARKFVCYFCGKAFSLPQYLREHQYRHTKEQPYVCGVGGCTRRFRQAGKLSLHRKTHPEYVTKRYDYTLNKDTGRKLKRSKKMRRKEPKYLNQSVTGSLNLAVKNKGFCQEDGLAIEENLDRGLGASNSEERSNTKNFLPLISMLQNKQELSIRTPSTKLLDQIAEKPSREKNIERINLDCFIKLLHTITNNPSQDKPLVKTQFSTLDLFSLVNNFER